ncbi:MAG: YHS domain-containing protein [Chloroflexi bacterium]|nr:YHS domain-containing protein [Chloroflexota bacterium]MDA8186639.1 YHS domain-containing protein [Dehalococcoidales bacterium]
MEIDPVCGMTVDASNPGATSEFQGKTYYFCCGECKKEFEKHPERYVQR